MFGHERVREKDGLVWAGARPGHFNLDPKTRTGTDPKIPDPEPTENVQVPFGSKFFLPERTRTAKEPTRIDTDPKRTDQNRPDPIRTDLYPT